MRSASLLLLLSGCADPGAEHEGIYVGNPELVALRLAQVDDEADTQAASFMLEELELELCSGDLVSATVGEYDLLGDDRLELPAGRWCGLTLVVDGALTATGTDSDHEDWSLTLETDDIEVKMKKGVEVDAESMVLRLGTPNWLKKELRADRSDATVDVGQPGDATYTSVVHRLINGTRLFADPDGDGWLTDEEARGPELGEGRVR